LHDWRGGGAGAAAAARVRGRDRDLERVAEVIACRGIGGARGGTDRVAVVAAAVAALPLVRVADRLGAVLAAVAGGQGLPDLRRPCVGRCGVPYAPLFRSLHDWRGGGAGAAAAARVRGRDRDLERVAEVIACRGIGGARGGTDRVAV